MLFIEWDHYSRYQQISDLHQWGEMKMLLIEIYLRRLIEIGENPVASFGNCP